MGIGHCNLAWCLSPNFGDALAPWLFERITGKRPIFAERNAKYPHSLISGSILNWANEHSVVWGAGLASLGDGVKAKDILAVRGPLTRLVAINQGMKCPEVYGDPALLLPRWIQPQNGKDFEIGIVPHYVDQFRIEERYRDSKYILYIDILGGIEHVVTQINRCKRVASSALHGLIAADAYGVPNLWCQFGDSIGGDGMKYWDYLISVGRATMNDRPMPMDFRSAELPLEVIAEWEKFPFRVGSVDTSKLWAACPLR